MTDQQNPAKAPLGPEDEDARAVGYGAEDEDPEAAVYGPEAEAPAPPVILGEVKKEFAPWHHPVKQVVRELQWNEHATRLLDLLPASEKLTLFTLPGPDLLDVRAMAQACHEQGRVIEYFGFDSSSKGRDRSWTANAILRQAGLVSPDAEVLDERLEDIANPVSRAASALRMKPPFDVVNIDACDHLAYKPDQRQHTTFDAIIALLEHQARRREPWLLFVTTRADPDQLGLPGVEFHKAILDNITRSPDVFGDEIARMIGAEPRLIHTALNDCWRRKDRSFLQLYATGLGKFLLRFLGDQPQLAADVSMVSAFAYRIAGDVPDMLALGFLITPRPVRMIATGASRQVTDAGPAELDLAMRIVDKAKNMWDIDQALDNDDGLRHDAFDGTEELLGPANYDIEAWREWVAKHPVRPLTRDEDRPPAKRDPGGN